MFRRIFPQLLVSITLLAWVNIAAAKSDAMPPPVVEAMTVQLQTWNSEISTIGTLAASQGTAIKPEINGKITALYFRSGDYVQANAPLVQINPDILKAQLASAQAKSILSKANYERAKLLFGRKVYAQADMDNALSLYQSDLANVAQNQALLDQTLIRAPFSGILGLRLVNLGDYVTAGQTLTNLEDLDPIRVDFSLPETDLSQIKVNSSITVRSRAYPDQVFQGQVYAFDSTIDPDTRTIGVRASVPNKDHKLLPGAYVDIILSTGAPQQALTIPETALSYSDKGEYVFKVAKGIATKTYVKVGVHRNNQVTITQGLQPGDVIVSAGQLKIIGDQSPVIVSNQAK